MIKIYRRAVTSTPILVFFIFTCTTPLAAQDFFDDDARFWLYVKLDKKISKRWETQLNFQNRFNNNITEFSQLNANGELTYKVNGNIKLQGGYVWGEKRKKEGFYLSRQQVYGGFIVKHRWEGFTFVYRNLVQTQTRASYNRDKARIPEYFSRNKLTVKYGLHRRLTIYSAGEINLPISRTSRETDLGPISVSRLRCFTGIVFNLSRNSYVESYFLYQRKYFTNGLPPRDFIYGLTLGHSF